MPELLATAVVVLLAALLALVAARGRPLRIGAAVGVGAIALLVGAAASRRAPPEPPQPADVPLQAAAADYATSDSCRACHPRQYDTWHDSYHRTMTQLASPRSVLGDFDDARVEFGGVHYWLYERDGRFYGEVDSPRWRAPRSYELVQTTGSHHMQVYWSASGEGRALESFPLVYLRDARRWVPRVAAFVTPPPADPAAPAPASVWNTTCIGCHSTHPRPRVRDAVTGGDAPIDTHVSELGITCEACHGPGAEHVAANRSPARRWGLHLTGRPDPTILDPRDLPHQRAAQVCGQCHGVKTFYSREQALDWMQHGSRFRPGEDLEKVTSVISNATFDRPYTQQVLASFPDLLRGSFWDDGIVRVTGREYNALLEAPCFRRGELTCSSCHTLHQSRDDPRPRADWADDQLAPDMDGDAACVQCHAGYADTARAAEHAHHEPGSTGSACQNCHMPHTTYGLLKAVRAHEISTPRVQTAGPGSARPNACNLCHLDRPLGWTAEHLERWYGQAPPALSADDRALAAGPRWALEGDAGVRALVAWSMGWPAAREAAGGDWLVPYLLELMQDPYDAVRLIARRSLAAQPGFEDAGGFDALAPPGERAAAARALAERWAARPVAPGERPARALYDAHGRIERAAFARLRERRDERPLNLAE